MRYILKQYLQNIITKCDIYNIWLDHIRHINKIHNILYYIGTETLNTNFIIIMLTRSMGNTLTHIKTMHRY